MKRRRWAVLLMFGLLLFKAKGFGEDRDWRIYGGDASSSQYSPLTQITIENVHQLEVAWHYRSGDARPEGRSQIQCNPIIVGRTLFGTSPQLKLFALDAATGEEQWVFDPFSKGDSLGVNRGVVYWENTKGRQNRILFCAGSRLFAIDAHNGKPIESFGEGGFVDLRKGLGRDASKLYVLSNTPGVVFEDLLILGTRVAEGPGPSAPGHIRAYRASTGELVWVFHTIPHPGEFGYETWPPDAWKRAGGANVWSGMSVDDQRGWVFCPTGSPAFDFWGGDRLGKNLFGNCLLVLDARSGKRIWHYQFVHHDLWDRDLPAAPNLIRLNIDKSSIEAVAQITKSGHIFVLDRDTGKPLFPIEEVPVPPSDLTGEDAWQTQPLPTFPPFARQSFTASMASPISHKSHFEILERLQEIRTGRPFIPPSVVGTLIFPGFDGGGHWGGAAWNPQTGILFVNASEMPWILTMVPTNKTQDDDFEGQRLYQRLCAVCHGINREGKIDQGIATLIGLSSRLSYEDCISILEEGRANMPSFGFLAASEKRRLIDFLLDRDALPNTKTQTKRSRHAIPYTHTGYNRFLDAEGYPAVEPPWGTLSAIDLAHGSILWQVALGEFEELSKRGIALTGTENYGGPIATAGGLLFIAATQDERFRAFDQSNGQILFEYKLPAGGYATPSSYSVDGRQYVVIACGGGKMGTPSGDSYIAFALPKIP